MSRFYAGIDLGARSCWLCVLDEDGHRCVNRKVPNDPERIVSLLRPFLPDLQAVVESTFN